MITKKCFNKNLAHARLASGNARQAHDLAHELDFELALVHDLNLLLNESKSTMKIKKKMKNKSFEKI